MPVTIIPNHRAARQAAPSSVYIFNANDFPHTLGLEQMSLSAKVGKNSSSWADVVVHGPLEVTKPAPAHHASRSTSEEAVEEAVTIHGPTLHGFLALPREIRLTILALAIRGEQYATPQGRRLQHFEDVVNLRDYVKLNHKPVYPGFLPKFCRVSKLAMEEGIAVLIENTVFMVASIADNVYLRDFLSGGPDRFKLVRSLDFYYFGRFPDKFEKNSDLELAAECTGLHSIKLTFHEQTLTSWVALGEYEYSLTAMPRVTDYLFQRYRLKRLVDCDHLKNIIIEHTGFYRNVAIEAGEKLGMFLTEKFAGKIPKQVSVRYGRPYNFSSVADRCN